MNDQELRDRIKRLERQAAFNARRLEAVRAEIRDFTEDGCDCDIGRPCPWHRIENAITATR